MTGGQVVVFGAGGHAKVVVDCLRDEGKFAVASLADADPAKAGRSIHGCVVVDEQQGMATARTQDGAIVAIGNNEARARIAQALLDAGVTLVSAVHRSAVIATTARIGRGTVVMPGAVVNADTAVGDNVIVNTRASIDHDCVIGDGVHVAPGTTICGGVRVGAGVLLGAGCVVLPGIAIGDGARIAAGAIVTNDVPAHETYAGNPARKLERRND